MCPLDQTPNRHMKRMAKMMRLIQVSAHVSIPQLRAVLLAHHHFRPNPESHHRANSPKPDLTIHMSTRCIKCQTTTQTALNTTIIQIRQIKWTIKPMLDTINASKCLVIQTFNMTECQAITGLNSVAFSHWVTITVDPNCPMVQWICC